MNSKGKPVIVCAADDAYAMPMAVMLRSLVDHLQRYPAVEIWVLDGGISRRNRDRVTASLPSGVATFNWVRPARGQLKGVPVFGHVSICTYYRLLMADLLPPGIHKVIYLDVDTLVKADIGELWDQDMGPHALLAFSETDRKVSDPLGLAMYKELGLSAEAPYFNAGVVVANLDLWRNLQLAPKFMAFIDRYARVINYWDQDVLNGVLAHTWGRLDEKWNSRVHNLWEKERLDREIDGMGIIHFASSVKPWTYGAHHAAESLYFHWIDMTAWAGWRPVKPWVDWLTVWRSLRNKHWYGQWIRRIPLVGWLWRLAMQWINRDSNTR